MLSVNNLSIKLKLILIQLSTVFIVLFLFSVFLVYNNIRSFEKSNSTRLISISQIIGSNCISALNFLDNEAAEEALTSLDAEEHIVNAWIFDADQTLFATYDKSDYADHIYSFPEDEDGVVSWFWKNKQG